jgi:outer membrane protein assembly factor BamD
MVKRTGLLAGGLLALFLAGGCGAPPKRLSPKEYFALATEAFTEEHFDTAVEKYGFLLDQYPLNPYAEEAQLKIAYAHYLDRNYAEAVAAFDDFERMYPLSPHLPFVAYYRGMCYAKQMRTIDRDQGVAEKALQYFREVVERYPESLFAALARGKIQVCREALAAHEFYVAEFYLDWYNAPAAVSRLRGILEDYPDTKALPKALARLEDGFREAGREEVALLARKALDYLEKNREREGDGAEGQAQGTALAGRVPGGGSPRLSGEGAAALERLIAELKELEKVTTDLATAPKRGAEKGAEAGEAQEGEEKVVVDREAHLR